MVKNRAQRFHKYYEKDEKTTVSIIKPTSAMGMINNKELHQIAVSVEAKLNSVFKAL